MTAFHDRMRALSVRMIDKFGSGGQATFTRTGPKVFDPISGNETTATTAHAAPVVVLPDDDRSREEARVLGWDVRFMVPLFADGFVPAPGDLVALPGRPAMTVVPPVEAPAPDGDVICFTIRARRG